MPAVVFGPDRVIRHERAKVGLVLGAGGVLGAAWMTGALACLQGGKRADPSAGRFSPRGPLGMNHLIDPD